MSDKCQRCGEEGQDRRTLWMACLYDMNELDIPFEIIDVGTRGFYTIKVCKGCRADWMTVIQKWFNTKPEEEPETGYYVRELGATVQKELPEPNQSELSMELDLEKRDG